MNIFKHINSISELDIYEENALRELLGGKTPFGFYKYYFENLENHPTNIECFNHVNNIYFELWGEYRYEDYNSFRNQYNRHLKTQK